MCVCICIYIYIYIYICHPQIDYFLVSQIFSMARHVGCLKLGPKPTQIYVRLSIIPLRQQANHVSSRIILLVSFFVSWHINLCELFNAKSILSEEQ